MVTKMRLERQRLGLQIGDVAKIVDLDPGNLSKIERALRPVPESARAVLQRIYGGCAIEELVGPA